MARVWEHCKKKTVCEADDPKDEEAEPVGEGQKRGHGGCGHIQPQIRKEGLKLFLVYKKAKDEDDPVYPSLRVARSCSLILALRHRTLKALQAPKNGYSLLQMHITS